MSSLYSRIADVPLTVEGYALEGLAADVGPFVRKTTVVRLRGGGHEGDGEDITWVGEDQEAFQSGPTLELAGQTTVDGFSRLLDRLQFFPKPPANLSPPACRLESAGDRLGERPARGVRGLSCVCDSRCHPSETSLLGWRFRFVEKGES